MKPKPLPSDFGIAEADIAKADGLKKWLFIGTAIGVIVILIVFRKYPWLIVFVFPPLSIIPVALYYSLKYLLCLAWPLYRSVQAYKNVAAEFEKWYLRTQAAFWDSLSGRQFEHEVANLLSRQGHNPQLNKGFDDKGVDIFLGTQTIIQCKAHKKPVGPAIARELFGTMKDHHARNAILISKSGFTKGTIEFSKRKPIQLWDMRTLIEMQKELDYGPPKP